MNQFFAAVEETEHPEILHNPLIVRTDPKEESGRGVVSTWRALRTCGLEFF